ncbi:MAG TPA: pyridoxamine 5'-phosphate oxidase family protein [bacterium]|nr:pyridoxamine 5'-phosphate oxidase family protein [bacterium]HPJ72239.1 pyridoxamine 5'-phosphate oxidase family protein [bacterium]HPQ65397.1 pyridoxamine 5'-phosphate oxidase family protein [bacterium]
MDFSVEMEKMLLEANVVTVATVDPLGRPNISLKSVVSVSREDPSIGYLELYDGRTARNVDSNPRICLAVSNVRDFHGYRFAGPVTVVDRGPVFQEMAAKWVEKRRRLLSLRIQDNIRKGYTGKGSEAQFPSPRSVVFLKVEEIRPL